MSASPILNASTDKQAWLEARAKTITATDVSAILGLHPYRTARSVYEEKKGLAPYAEESEAMMIGQELEPFIAALYCRKKGLVYGTEVIPSGFVTHPQYPRHGATPDFHIPLTDELLECKYAGPNTARMFGEEETDEIPTHYLCQVMWQLHCTGKKRATLCLFTAFGKLKTYTIERDDEMIRRMVFRVNMFIGEYLDADMPPPISGHQPDTDCLNEKFARGDNDKLITATYEIEEVVEKLAAIRDQKREIELKESECLNQIREHMQDATVMETGHGNFTWRNNKDSVKTDYQTCFDGLRCYVQLMLAQDKEKSELLSSECVRLVNANTVTKPGARVLRTPFRSEKA